MLNASSVFQLVFKLVQATVQQRTLSKIGIFGSDSELWPEEVRSKLRKHGAKVNRGGQVPRSLYLVNGEREYFMRIIMRRFISLDSKKSVIGPGKCVVFKFSEQFPFQLR